MADRRTAIHFFCDNGNCTSDIGEKTFPKATLMTLIADGTSVTLTFTRSPFRSGQTVIQIPAGTFVREQVAGKSGHFKFSVGCSSCSSDNDDADFIVDL